MIAKRFQECLEAITGMMPPSHFDPRIEECWDEIQQWCVYHARPQWATGIAIFEAAEKMIEEAIDNGNIDEEGNIL